jgi:pyruvate/2-oxoglutarate dehydrogenase complex dihydrolipoamide acyltransferase (E2) component
MFRNRPKMAFADMPIDDVPERSGSPWLLRGALPPRQNLRRALFIAPLAVVAYLVFRFAFLEPSPPAAPVRSVIEAKAEAHLPPPPVPAPPPEQAVEAKAAPPAQPEPAAAPPPPGREAASAPLNRDEIKEMQGKLAAVGFGPGPIDGVVGPQTQSALRRYGESRSLPKAEPTQEVLSRLRAETQAKP